MVLSAGRVPARDGRRLALQGPLPLGDHLRNCSAVSLRLRFLFDAVPSRDSVLRDHRSRGGGRGVAGGAAGGGGGGGPPPPPRRGGGGVCSHTTRGNRGGCAVCVVGRR